MSKAETGYAIDVNTFTVLLVGKELISDLMKAVPNALINDAMSAYNQIALYIVKTCGSAYGIDPENIPERERWSLGTTTKEDSDYMRSFLPVKELMRSEVVSYTNEKEIAPIKE